MREPLDVALAYYRAWTGNDLDAAMKLISEDLVCDAPPGRLVGAAAFRAFLEPFAGTLTSTTLIAAFGDGEKALIMYDTASTRVPSAPGAECLTVVDGLVTHDRFIFDRVPFRG